MRQPTLNLIIGTAFAWLAATPVVPASAQTTFNATALIADWPNAAASAHALWLQNNGDAKIKAHSQLTSAKQEIISGILSGSQSLTLTSNWINQLLTTIANTTPEALEATDFTIGLPNPDYNGNQSPLLTLPRATTKALLVKNNPLLAVAQMVAATSDEEAAPLINKYGVLEEIAHTVLTHAAWKNAHIAIASSRNATHPIWLALLSKSPYDEVRAILAANNPSDPWLMVACYATAQGALKAQLATQVAQLTGLDPKTLLSQSGMAVNQSDLQTQLDQNAQAGHNYVNAVFDDDHQAQRDEGNGLVNDMQNQQAQWKPSIARLNQISVVSPGTPPAQNYTSLLKEMALLWHQRAPSPNGQSVNPAQIIQAVTDPDLKTIIIQQGNANAQLSLLQQTEQNGDTTLNPIDLVTIIRHSRNNTIIARIAAYPKATGKVRLAIICHLRYDAQARAIYTTLINGDPPNPEEVRLMALHAVPQDFMVAALAKNPEVDNVRGAALSTFPNVVRFAMQQQPQDTNTFRNGMGIQHLLLALNDTTTRDLVVQTPFYLDIYKDFNLGQVEEFYRTFQDQTTQVKAQNTAAAAATYSITPEQWSKINPDPSAAWTNTHVFTSPALNGGQVAFTLQSGFYTAQDRQQLLSAGSPNNLDQLNQAFWPTPAGYANQTLASAGGTTEGGITASRANAVTAKAAVVDKANQELQTRRYLVPVVQADGSTKYEVKTATVNGTTFDQYQQTATGQGTADILNSANSTSAAAWQKQFQSGATTSGGNPTAAANIINTIDDQNYSLTLAARQQADQAKKSAALPTTTALPTAPAGQSSLVGLIAALDALKTKAAMERAGWVARTDLTMVDNTHPYYASLPSALKAYPWILIQSVNDPSTRTLRTANSEIKEYQPDGQPNPAFTAFIDQLGHEPWTIAETTTNGTTTWVDYYRYLEYAWKDKYFGDKPGTITTIEAQISQKEKTVAAPELLAIVNTLQTQADQEKAAADALIPNEFIEGSADYTRLTPEQKNSPFIFTTTAQNKVVKYYDRYADAMATWNNKYSGPQKGSLSYYKTLLYQIQVGR